MSNDNYSFKPYVLYADERATSSGSGLTESSKRKLAVEAALDLIRAQSLSGKGEVENTLKYLNEYADKIQEALKMNPS